MPTYPFTALATALALTSSPVFGRDREPFTGPYLGGALGAVNHHFVVEESDGAEDTRRFNVLKWGVGVEAFGGFDLAVARSVRLGGEAQFEAGGRLAVERNSNYTFGFRPRFGYSVSTRFGYVVAPAVMAYAGAGYGEHRYRTIFAGNVDPGARNSLDRTRSFVLRVGAEARLFPTSGREAGV